MPQADVHILYEVYEFRSAGRLGEAGNRGELGEWIRFIDGLAILPFPSGFKAMRLLVAEDDGPLGRFIARGFAAEENTVDLVPDGIQAKSFAANGEYDVLILDLNLPGLHGIEVLKAVRQLSPELPIIVLTARNAISDRVLCLDGGADDYVVKPFSFSELSARVRALLRRRKRPVAMNLTVADLEMDRIQRKAWRSGKEIELTPKEFALLEYLLLNAGRRVTRHMIMEQVWNLPPETPSNVVDVYVNHLRKKVDSEYPAKLIRTVRGVGYEIGGTVKGREKPPQ